MECNVSLWTQLIQANCIMDDYDPCELECPLAQFF